MFLVFLLNVIVLAIIVALVNWGLASFGAPPVIMQIIYVVAVIMAVLWALQLFGLNLPIKAPYIVNK